MPKVNGNVWRHRRAQLGITSEEAAKLLRMADKGGSLRSIELGIKPASLALAYRAARLYSCDVLELLAADEVPDQPPSKEQENETNTAPPKRTNGGKAGPKRLSGAAA